MKKALRTIEYTTLYHELDGQKVLGKNPNMSGNCFGLVGDCTGLAGDCSGLFGDCTGVYGNCVGVWGNFYECNLTKEDREKGINIRELIGG